MKKKQTGLYVLSLLLLFILSLENSCIASEAFNITPNNLKGMWQHFYRNQAEEAVSGDQYYQAKLNVWTSGDILINSISDEQWLEMCQVLNATMQDFWINSGEFYGYNTTSMEDNNLWVFIIPEQAQTTNICKPAFIFIPQIAVTTQLLENRNQYNGSTFYSIQPYFYLNQDDGNGGYSVSTSQISNTNSPAIALIINEDKTYTVGYRGNYAITTRLNNLATFFRQWEPIEYSSSYTQFIEYYGIFTTYRDNYWATLKGASSFKRNYGANVWLPAYNGFRYNLNNDRVESGEITTPTITPQPTTSGSGGITKEEMTEAIGSYWGNENDLSGEKQEEEISNAVNGIMDNISGDFSNNAIVKTLESGEAGFLSFFESGHDENWYDLKFSWGNIDLDYKWNNEDVNGQYFISGDSINISAMCREVPILGTIQTLIRTIFNFSICMMLVKQIWNLLLATLGIDNPYLYENPDEEDISFSINENTGGITKTIRKGKITRRKTI